MGSAKYPANKHAPPTEISPSSAIPSSVTRETSQFEIGNPIGTLFNSSLSKMVGKSLQSKNVQSPETSVVPYRFMIVVSGRTS
uniref:Uncharacterized protein n=1 Tax=Arundo donax TaxID=35708 RepID=A0A0A9DVV6_ARUDO